MVLLAKMADLVRQYRKLRIVGGIFSRQAGKSLALERLYFSGFTGGRAIAIASRDIPVAAAGLL